MAAFHTPTQHYYAGSVTGGSSASSSNPFYSPQYDAGSGAPGYYSRTSSWGSTSTSSSTSPYGCGGNSGPSDGALILYNPAATLGGLYYSDDMHGPFATGRTHNPFVPGEPRRRRRRRRARARARAAGWVLAPRLPRRGRGWLLLPQICRLAIFQPYRGLSPRPSRPPSWSRP